MKPHTATLHYALIRFLRGMVAAWELWVKSDEEKEAK